MLLGRNGTNWQASLLESQQLNKQTNKKKKTTEKQTDKQTNGPTKVR